MNIFTDLTKEGIPRSTSDISSLVIHHTGSPASDKNMLSFLKKPDYISAHYLVQKDGSITQLVPLNRAAYHAGISSYQGLETKNNSLNWCTIGIEVNSNGVDFTDKQRVATKELIMYLVNKFDIDEKFILKHRDIAPFRKVDIADAFYKPEYPSWEAYQQSFKDPFLMTEQQKKLIETCIMDCQNLYAMAEIQGNETLKIKAHEQADAFRAMLQ